MTRGRGRRRGHGRAILLGVLLAVVGGAVAGVLAGFLRSAPTLEEVRFRPEMTSYVYDIHGNPIARLATEHRVPVSIREVPPALQEAVIAVEDERFMEHRGIDFRAILRALWRDLQRLVRGGGGYLEGGSTLTQQLAKNAFLSQDRTLTRKILDAIWAVQIERRYTKEEILEAYLNEVYFGHGANGVEAAARVYFGKSVRDLDLAESALLAGVLRSPGLYSPFINPEAAVRRRNLVLDLMAEQGYISHRQAEEAKQEPVPTVPPKNAPTTQASYFVDYVLEQLRQRFNDEQIFSGGLRIYTTLDVDMQRKAEQALLAGLPTREQGQVDEKGLTQPQGALVAIDPATGYIKAMVGGRGQDKFNRAVQAYRSPGSAIKPFIYVAAIDKGYTPADVFVDEPIQYTLPTGELWTPQNYDLSFRGPITLREALEESINIVAIKLLEEVGVRQAVSYAEKMGISSIVTSGPMNDLNLNFALGGLTKGVTPLELASAYGVLANGGIRVEPIALLRVEDASGFVLEEYRPKKQVVLPETTAYVVTDMLRGVLVRGTGRRAQLGGRPAAGKTGTAQNYSNAWFVGYTPDLVAAVWIGNDLQAQPMSYSWGNIGSSRAAEIWGNFMRQALQGVPPRDFPRPDGIVDDVLIDTETGLLATPGCRISPDRLRYEIFVEGTEPKELAPDCTASRGLIPSLLDLLRPSGDNQGSRVPITEPR